MNSIFSKKEKQILAYIITCTIIGIINLIHGMKNQIAKHYVQICPLPNKWIDLYYLIGKDAIDDIRGACAVKGKVSVAGHVKRVDHGDAFDALLFRKKTSTGHYFILKFDLSWGIRTNMGKTEGIFLNFQCICHRVAYIFKKLINHRTNFSTCCQIWQRYE